MACVCCLQYRMWRDFRDPAYLGPRVLDKLAVALLLMTYASAMTILSSLCVRKIFIMTSFVEGAAGKWASDTPAHEHTLETSHGQGVNRGDWAWCAGCTGT